MPNGVRSPLKEWVLGNPNLKIFLIIKNLWISPGNFRGFAVFDLFFHQLILLLFIFCFYTTYDCPGENKITNFKAHFNLIENCFKEFTSIKSNFYK